MEWRGQRSYRGDSSCNGEGRPADRLAGDCEPLSSPIAVSSWRPATVTTRSAPIPTAAPVTWPAAERARRNRRCRRSWLVSGDNYDRTMRTHAQTFASQILLIAQSQVDDPALAAGHGIEVKGNSRTLHFFCRRECTHSQLLNSKKTIIIRVK